MRPEEEGFLGGMQERPTERERLLKPLPSTATAAPTAGGACGRCRLRGLVTAAAAALLGAAALSSAALRGAVLGRGGAAHRSLPPHAGSSGDDEASKTVLTDSALAVPTNASLMQEWDKKQSTADNALFLIQATFGPTRGSLEQLGKTTYASWIGKQMKLPAELHRAYFRTRANPHCDLANCSQNGFAVRSPCSKGSRWHGYTFTKVDIGSSISIVERPGSRGKQIFVDGAWRSDLDPRPSGSRAASSQCTNTPPPWVKKQNWCVKNAKSGRCRSHWWIIKKYCQQSCFDQGFGYEGDDCSVPWATFVQKPLFKGYICSVDEAVDGLVKISADESCGATQVVLNLAISLADTARSTQTALEFITSPLLPDVIFLAQGSAGCDLGQYPVIRYLGRFYRHDLRMQLFMNTPENPHDFGDVKLCVAKNFLNERTCRVLPPSSGGCYAACGSFGEVANVPREGHAFVFFTSKLTKAKPDSTRDFQGAIAPRLTKSTVWTMKALQAEDQLRQRMAWALSQIFVVGVPGFAGNLATEIWTNYYDIFVRNAFANFRDVLREVTYSPLMSLYLTYAWSKSYNVGRAYPDENYAREVMQLFTIGVTKLHANGSDVVDKHGEAVPTYDNENVMNFARVFTGFRPQGHPRTNLEKAPSIGGANDIDPLEMWGPFHDVYPKPDLDGNYLGDGYPLCADLPKGAFLAKGARYDFMGYSHSGDAFEVDADSDLLPVLCPRSGPRCAFAMVVELPAALKCHGQECDLEAPDVFKVGDGFYMYVPPPCVYSFFYSGKLVASGTRFKLQHCANPDLPLAGVACCKGCSNRVPPWMHKNGKTCESANLKAPFCRRQAAGSPYPFCLKTCSEKKLAKFKLDCSVEYAEQLSCHHQYQRVPFSSAKAMCSSLGMTVCPLPANAKCGQASMQVWTPSPCSRAVRVFPDGKVGLHPDLPANSFRAAWVGGVAPAAGNYTGARVEVRPAFGRVPKREELLASLKIGAFAPTGPCTHACRGQVRAYAVGQHIDANTVFECDGRFFKNVHSIVHVKGGSFRNPPVFMPLSDHQTPRQMDPRLTTHAALAEVASLLDHLVRHANTPIFIGKRLIQRFVTSNPSPAYLLAVTQAFRTGTWRGTRYSGKYGDLGATLAAILLHPEARSQSSATNGLLREPLLQLVHFMRSMEYTEEGNEQVVLPLLDQSLIGQFPYHQPSVFNFFYADYQPSGFSMGEPEPEPESEPEHHSRRLVAPEFQLFTAPFALGLLNGLSTMIGFGFFCRGSLVAARGGGCQKSSLQLPEPRTAREALEQLGILLTGGRLTPASAQVVLAAYNGAEEGFGLEAAQQAAVLTPEFHTLGRPRPSGAAPPRAAEAAAQQPRAPRPYKAVVMLFLAGGADTFQMLVPMGCSLYNEYQKVRKGAAFEEKQLHRISAASQECKTFGVHPELSFVADLYEKQGQAAFVSNIGALVEPTTRTQQQKKASKLCPGMFSHADQQAAAQSLQCQIHGVVPTGVGGRIADALIADGYKVASFSVAAGMSRWSEGMHTHVEIIDKLEGVRRLEKYKLLEPAINNITSQSFDNVYCEEYVRLFANAVNSSETLGRYMDEAKLKTTYDTDTFLAQELHQVARLISTRGRRRAERDFFFVKMDGFDTHRAMQFRFGNLMKVLNSALGDFVAELKAQGVFESTVLATASDFGRTLTINSGSGTDHGWGGNHLIIGGDIKGGQVFNDFPEALTEGGEYDAGRGRIIPKYPWESMVVPIAEWLGVKAVEQVFPNLGNFNRSTHIVSRGRLFKP